jgi:plasmid stabilization system protein ParE
MTSHRRVGPALGKTKSGILWSARALADLYDIGDYIARDDPEAARRWLSKLTRAAERSKRFPYAGRIVPEIGRPEIREILVKSYRIVYRIRDGKIEILTVFEGHRRLVASDLPNEP